MRNRIALLCSCVVTLTIALSAGFAISANSQVVSPSASPSGGNGVTVWVGNVNSNSSTILNVGGKSSSQTILFSCSPFDVLRNGAGSIVYYSFRNCTGGANGIGALNTATNQLTFFNGPQNPAKMALALNGTRLVVADEVASGTQVYVFDTATNAIVDRIDTTLQASGADFAYTVDVFGSSMAVGTSTGYTLLYDMSTVPATFKAMQADVGGFTRIIHVAFTPSGTELYRALDPPTATLDQNGSQTIAGNLHFLNAATLAVKSVQNVSSGQLQYVVPVNGSYMYVTSFDGTISAFDAATDTLLNTLSLGAGSIAFGFAPDGKVGYVADAGNNTAVQIIFGSKPVRDKIGKSFPVGNTPIGVAAH